MLPALLLKDTPNEPVVATSGFEHLPEDAQSSVLAAMMKSNPEEACRTIQAMRKAGLNPSEDFWGNVAYLAGLKKREKDATFRELVTRFCQVGRYEEPLKRYFAAAKFGYIDMLREIEEQHPKELELKPDPNPNPMSLHANSWKPKNSVHRALIVAASWGKLDTMKYLWKRIMEVGPKFQFAYPLREYMQDGVFKAAAASGSVPALEWCLKNGATRDMYYNAAVVASVPKVIDAVWWFEKQGFDYTGMENLLFDNAAANGSLINMEEFYRRSQSSPPEDSKKKRKPVDLSRAFGLAAIYGQVEAMEWIANVKKLPYEAWRGAFLYAARDGQIEALKYTYSTPFGVHNQDTLTEAGLLVPFDIYAASALAALTTTAPNKAQRMEWHNRFKAHGERPLKSKEAGAKACIAFLDERLRERRSRTQW